jgi:hypothetical protein
VAVSGSVQESEECRKARDRDMIHEDDLQLKHGPVDGYGIA